MKLYMKDACPKCKKADTLLMLHDMDCILVPFELNREEFMQNGITEVPTLILDDGQKLEGFDAVVDYAVNGWEGRCV